MVTKYFLFVCKSRKTGATYLSDCVYSVDELKDSLVDLDSIGVDVIDVISVELDFSKYEH